MRGSAGIELLGQDGGVAVSGRVHTRTGEDRLVGVRLKGGLGCGQHDVKP